MEQRKYPRFQVGFPVAFAGDEASGKGEVINISMGGCAIESDVSVKTGTYLKLRLFLPDQKSPIGIQLATVRWSTGQAFAVEFIRIEKEFQEIISRFIQTLFVEVSH